MNRLYYKKPAKEWVEALPIGNGRLGAMIFGKFPEEHIQLNEDSVWYGGPINRINPDAGKNFEKIRSLVKAGRIQEAEKLQMMACSGVPQSQRPYQMLGDFYYHMNVESEKVTDYERELDLSEGIHKVRYTYNGVLYQTEAFASAVDDVIVINITASQPGKISLNGIVTRGRLYNSAGKLADDTIYLDGDLGKGGSDFALAVRAVAKNGTVTVLGEHLLVEEADQVTIYIDGATTFPYQKQSISCPKDFLKGKSGRYTTQSYNAVKEKHITEYKELFDRSYVRIEYDPEVEQLPTDERVARVAAGKEDTGLISLYYDYGRYLLMSSSRPGTLPANLQGIWCDKLQPIWDSKYTININTEMNYWPAEVCNLSECHEPLFELLKRVMETGKKTAQEMYGCRGFVAHHNTDIWADTAPQDFAYQATHWVMGGAWLSTHIWNHYTYSGDDNFLREMFPVLKECVQFFLDFLIEEDGEMVTCPSVSPENTYIMEDGSRGHITMGCTMDNAILRDIFQQYMQSAEILKENDEFSKQVGAVMEKLPPYRIGKHGQILEWREDYEEFEVGHRHFSHLYPLFPSKQINEYDSPELVTACEKALLRRMEHGGGHTGWSCAWLINLYARLQNGDKANEYLNYLFTNLSAPNLFDLHPPLEHEQWIRTVFQIDGNFGATCGIAQMLLQSHLEEIHLLPALPSAWKTGKAKGLCAENGFTVTMSWESGTLKSAVVTSKLGKDAVIRYHHKVTIQKDNCEYASKTDERGNVIFHTNPGESYELVIH